MLYESSRKGKRMPCMVLKIAHQGEADDNQVADAKIGMAQNIGGSGATAVTHVLKRD